MKNSMLIKSYFKVNAKEQILSLLHISSCNLRVLLVHISILRCYQDHVFTAEQEKTYTFITVILGCFFSLKAVNNRRSDVYHSIPFLS